VRPRKVLDWGKTPDGSRLELALERGHYMISIDGIPLMSSEVSGSERAMAIFAREALGRDGGVDVLIGGLGMGFTLRSALDAFGEHARVCVAELLPTVIRYGQGVLSHLADHPLEDPRVDLYEGDFRDKLAPNAWDVVLLDVDNGPDALTTRTNDRLYGERGVARMWEAVRPGGVLVVWSSFESNIFRKRLEGAGFVVRVEQVRSRWPLVKGAVHTLFIATRPA
jgi:spermidine synthase